MRHKKHVWVNKNISPLKWVIELFNYFSHYRRRTFQYILLITAVVIILGFILIFAIQVDSFINNLAINLLTEIAGTLLIIVILEGYIRKAREKIQIEEETREDFIRLFENFMKQYERLGDEKSQQKYIEVSQSYSWYKWIKLRDETGYFELREHAQQGPLSLKICTALKWELEKLQRDAYMEGILIQKLESNQVLEERLTELISSNQKTVSKKPKKVKPKITKGHK